MDKIEVVRILEEIAGMLELQGENPFKIQAYRNAAHALLNMAEDFAKVVQEKRLTEFEGIGPHTAEKISQLALEGDLPYYERLKNVTPEGILDLMQVRGLGARRCKEIYDELKITSLADLKEACLAGRIAKLPGFGIKTEQNILDSLAHQELYSQRHLWWHAMALATPILEGLREIKGVTNAEIAGSLRRRLETIGDLDFLVAASHPEAVMQWFTKHPQVEKVIAQGSTKATVRLQDATIADLRVVTPAQFGFAFLYFTGSKEHNIKIRERAQARGWSLSEYDMEVIDKKAIAPFPKGRKITEKDIYQALGLTYIPPEIRENRGEIELAAKGKLPSLIEIGQIRGTFHNHTTASDGKSTLCEMVAAAEKLGWEYIGIADHSKSSFQAKGLSEEQLSLQLEEIEKLNQSGTFRPHIFAGVECDILQDGSLDCSHELLKKLHYVVISVHNAFNQDAATMTKRLIRAIEDPYATMLGHVTGRLLLKREPYALNIAKVIDACIANDTIMELNASPQRLDMDWRLWQKAAERGLKCCINTDAHATEHLQFLLAGINSARKGWLTKKDVINTLPLKQMQKLLCKMRLHQ